MHKETISLIDDEKALLNDRGIADAFNKYFCGIMRLMLTLWSFP